MASVDKVKVGQATYHMSPSKDGTLTGYTSNDSASPTAWTATDVVVTSDSNSSIFAKVTTMVKNIRWLYSKLGTTDFSSTGQSTVTGALSSLQDGLDDKAPTNHTHTTSDLPVSSTQINSTSYIPTSALAYSMQQQITSLNDALTELTPKPATDDPNTRWNNSGYTWSSTSDVDTFFNRFNHNNNYSDGDTKLNLGDTITINDGTYNAVWMIAGFDMEHNQTAADGTVYDNGYGICMIASNSVISAKWNDTNTLNGAYKSSTIHTSTLPTIVTKLKNVLGNHIINRNVLLSSGTDTTNYYSNAYTWTTSYATLMSVGQLTGEFARYRNKYDDGEANYKLPLFNYMDYNTGSGFWSRGICGIYNNYYEAWNFYNDFIDFCFVNASTSGVRPLIYLR